MTELQKSHGARRKSAGVRREGEDRWTERDYLGGGEGGGGGERLRGRTGRLEGETVCHTDPVLIIDVH